MSMQVSPGSMARMAVAMGAVTLLTSGLLMPISVQAAKPEMKIEVTMKDKAYIVKGVLTPGALTAIVVRNEDSVTHGFSSPVFKEAIVRKEGGGVEFKGGQGQRSQVPPPGSRADHDSVFQERFSAGCRDWDSDTQQIPFWCDLHANMKGNSWS